MNLDELKAAAAEAGVALSRAQRLVAEEARVAASKATDAVRAKHADEIAALEKASLDARLAHDEAVSAAASHPWEGKWVFRTERKGRWGNGVARTDGIVRVRRCGDHPGAANQVYGLPRIGQAYILPLRQDGSPGIRVLETFRDDGTTSGGWRLSEGKE